jgi:hypothetical protein
MIINNLKILTACVVILTVAASSKAEAQFKFRESPETGTLTLLDGRSPILSYCMGDQLKPGVDPKYTRSCYIHPLFSLDGKQELTEDFPQDHLHHHGVFWTWPAVKTRGQDTQTWHPADPSLRQHFVRWIDRTVIDLVARLRAEIVWKLADREVVAREILSICVYPCSDFGRTLDIEISLEALGGPLELQGAPDQNKGYGGLCLRGAPVLTKAVMTTDRGPLEKDATNEPFRWADLSTPDLGIAIFVSPLHPNFPTTWLIRNSYAGVLNPSWPGLKSVVLDPGNPVTLGYRIYIHRGDVNSGGVGQAYDRYVSGSK